MVMQRSKYDTDRPVKNATVLFRRAFGSYARFSTAFLCRPTSYARTRR